MATLLTGGTILVILARITTILAVDLGTFDLSATGRVKLGRYPEAPTLPFVAVDLERVDSEQTDVPLGHYRHRATVLIQGWCAPASASDTPGSATVGALVLADEVATAIELDHKSGGAGSLKAIGVRQVVFTSTEFHGTEQTGRHIARWSARLEIVYATSQGI